MSDDDKPVLLPSNEYWGNRSGGIDQRPSSPTYRQPIFQIPRPAVKTGGNSGPVGKRRSRWYQGQYKSLPGRSKR